MTFEQKFIHTQTINALHHYVLVVAHERLFEMFS